MSYLTEQEIACPFCKHPTSAEIWSLINVKEDPELKDILLGGELNMTECNACHKVFYVEHFLLYHDPDNELMAFVYPYADRAERAVYEEKTKTDFDQTQSQVPETDKIKYEPVTLFGLDELVRLVEHEEEVAIQSEIVSLLAKEHGLSVRQLKPAIARKLKLPTVLPFKNDPNLSHRESLLAALSSLHDINDKLTVYNETRKMIAENPAVDYSLAG